jgi:hypothetical protein
MTQRKEDSTVATMTHAYDSPPRNNVMSDGSSRASPKSTIDYNEIEFDNSIHILKTSVDLERQGQIRESLDSKAVYKVQHTKLRREETNTKEIVRSLESDLQDAKNEALQAQSELSVFQEQEEVEAELLWVQKLNLEILRKLLQDRDSQDLYAQRIKPRTTAFGLQFEAKTRGEVAITKHRLEQVQYLLAASKNGRKYGDEQKVQQVATMKLGAIRKYNRVNNIVFDSSYNA